MIHARMLYTYVKSPFTLYCDLFVDAKFKDPMNSYQQMLFDAGRAHEEDIVDEKFEGAHEVSTSDRDEGFLELLSLMKDGVEVLHNFPLFFEDLTGDVDVLERVSGQSKFGSYYYVVKEIKVAKNIKEHHKIQAWFYNYVLGKIQGYTPSVVYLVNRDGEEFEIEYDESRMLSVLEGVRSIMNGLEVSPTYGKGDWPWETYTNSVAKEKRDVSLVAGVGLTMKEKLVAAGIHSFDDLAKMNIEALTELQGFGPATAQKLLNSAKALSLGDAVKIKECVLPQCKTEIFLDLEGTGQPLDKEGLAPIDYLIGCLVRKDGVEEFIPFVAHSENEEKKMFLEFVSWLKEQEDYVIYHWHHYEKTHMKKMAVKYGVDLELLLPHMIDLYTVATKSFAFPTYGNSIKAIAPWMGFTWRHKEVNAMESIAYYVDYIEDPVANKDKLDKVIDYNHDDVIATRVVKDWLFAH